MVNPAALGLASALALILASGPVEDDPSRAVGSALGKGGYPWYDAEHDRARPLPLPSEPGPSRAEAASAPGSSGWSIRSVGDAIALVAFGVLLIALVGLLIWFWRIYEPIDATGGPARATGGAGPSRVEALPAGMLGGFDSSDPWSEAIRLRDRGDLAGAVILVFAHQLLTLSRLELVRLAPGRTGRQLLRSVADADLRALAQPTLRLFEAVYYGHRTPTPGEFAAAWESAEAFERRVTGEGVT